MNIIFNINHLGLEGLGATLTSMLRNCSNKDDLKIWFFCNKIHEKDKNNIGRLLKAEHFYGSYRYIDFDAQAIFGHLNALHGDWTAYGRLLISRYVSGDSALYLDADLVILLDVLSLKELDFEGAALAAVYGSTIKWKLDKSFFLEKLNWSDEMGYFNSGVVFFNLKKWREDDFDSKWKKLTDNYPDDLISHDQTLLNAICEGNFAQLEPNFNTAWVAGNCEPKQVENSILHFIGSPKPWDIFGKRLHMGYETWKGYSTNVWKDEYGRMSIEKIKRTWKIRRSIVRIFIKKILGGG